MPGSGLGQEMYKKSLKYLLILESKKAIKDFRVMAKHLRVNLRRPPLAKGGTI